MRSGKHKIWASIVLLFIAAVLYYGRSGPDPEGADEGLQQPAPVPHLAQSTINRAETDSNNPNGHSDEYLTSSHRLISLGNAGQVRIRWHRKPVPRLSMEGPPAEVYARLRDMAIEGDVEAAFRLWTMLDSCQFAYEKSEDLQSALNTLSQTQSVKLPEMDEAKYVGDKSAKTYEEALRLSFEHCRGVTDEMKAEKTGWLKQASDVGYPLAMMNYSDVEKGYASAMDLETRRWQAGDSAAMLKLYELYQEKYISGEMPDNNIIAYAHLLVYRQISEKKWGPNSRRMEGLLPQFEIATALMRPNELEAASALARDLIESNPNCCFKH